MMKNKRIILLIALPLILYLAVVAFADNSATVAVYPTIVKGNVTNLTLNFTITPLGPDPLSHINVTFTSSSWPAPPNTSTTICPIVNGSQWLAYRSYSNEIECRNATSTSLANSPINMSIGTTSPSSGGNYSFEIETWDTNHFVNRTGVTIWVDTWIPFFYTFSPTNGTTNSINQTLIYSVYDNNGQPCIFENNSVNYTLPTCDTGPDYFNFTAISGFNTIKIFANDSVNNTNVTNMSFTVDLSTPSLNISSPQNRTYISRNITVNYTSSDIDGFPLTCILQKTDSPGAENVTMTDCQNITLWYTSEGLITMKIFSIDSGGNTNVSNVTFTIDTSIPFFYIDSPINGTTRWLNQTLIYRVFGNDGDSCIFENNSVNYTLSECDSSYSYFNFTAIPGLNTIKIFANDSDNNWNVTNMSFTVDLSKPEISIVFPLNITTNDSNQGAVFDVSDADGQPITCVMQNNSFGNWTINDCHYLPFVPQRGWNTIKIFATDAAGNENVSNISFTVDQINGSYSLPTPGNGSFLQTNFTYVNVTIDSYYPADSCILQWNGTNETMSMATSKTYCYKNKTSLTDGIHRFKIFMNTTINATGHTNLTSVIVDTSVPNITIRSPLNMTYNSSNTNLNITATDDGLSGCILQNNSINYTIDCDINMTIFASYGPNTIKIFAYDSAGNTNVSIVSFTTVDFPPSILLTSPQNTTYKSTNMTLTVNASDSDGQPVTCVLQNNTVNFSISCDTTMNFIGVEGQNTIKIFANDTGNNSNVSIVSFTVDSSPPSINIFSPMNKTYNTSNITLNYTTSDSDGLPITCIYQDKDAPGAQNYSMSNCNNVSFIASEGQNTIKVFVVDTPGNVNMSKVSFTVDASFPSPYLLEPKNKTYHTLSLSLAYQATDNDGLPCVFENNSINYTLQSCHDNYEFLGFYAIPGFNIVKLFTNDSANNTNVTVRSFTVDLSAPTVNITSPTNTTYTSTNISINYTATDADGFPLRCFLEYNGANSSLANCTNITFLASSGFNTVKIFVNDSGDNSNSSFVSFTVDATPPEIYISYPENTTYNSLNQTFIFTINDSDDQLTCIIENNTVNYTMPSCDGFNFTAIAGDNNMKLFVTDSANNTNVSSISFRIDTTPPSIIIYSPTSTTYSSTNISLSFVASDIYDPPQQCVFENNGVNTSIAGCINITFIAPAGSNNIKVFASDSGGNTDVSSVSFTVTTSTGDSNPSGGSSSGSGSTSITTTSSPKETLVISGSQHTGDVVPFNFSNSESHAIESIDINVSQYVYSPSISVQETAKPATVSSAVATGSGSVYKYIQITPSITNSAISSAVITFTVPKSWIDQIGADPNSTILEKNEGDNWTELPTHETSFDGVNYTYESNTTSFSLYAIIARNLIIEQTQNNQQIINSTTAESNLGSEAAPISTTADATNQDLATNNETLIQISAHSDDTMIFAGIAIIIVIIIVAAVFYITRKKENSKTQEIIEKLKAEENGEGFSIYDGG